MFANGLCPLGEEKELIKQYCDLPYKPRIRFDFEELLSAKFLVISNMNDTDYLLEYLGKHEVRKAPIVILTGYQKIGVTNYLNNLLNDKDSFSLYIPHIGSSLSIGLVDNDLGRKAIEELSYIIFEPNITFQLKDATMLEAQAQYMVNKKKGLRLYNKAFVQLLKEHNLTFDIMSALEESDSDNQESDDIQFHFMDKK